MSRNSKILICSVCLVAAVVISLPVLAHFNRKSNKIATWRLNLEEIEIAKHEWADDSLNVTNNTPTLDDLRPFLSDWVTNHISWTNGELVDPDGGVYTIGRVGELPSCLIGGRRVYP
jgi:hypothetical protein